MNFRSRCEGRVSGRRQEPHSHTAWTGPNADGSGDRYFGPTAPAGEDATWIETVPGRGFYPMFRFYTPLPGVFDGSWQLSDVEVAK